MHVLAAVCTRQVQVHVESRPDNQRLHLYIRVKSKTLLKFPSVLHPNHMSKGFAKRYVKLPISLVYLRSNQGGYPRSTFLRYTRGDFFEAQDKA